MLQNIDYYNVVGASVIGRCARLSPFGSYVCIPYSNGPPVEELDVSLGVFTDMVHVKNMREATCVGLNNEQRARILTVPKPGRLYCPVVKAPWAYEVQTLICERWAFAVAFVHPLLGSNLSKAV